MTRPCDQAELEQENQKLKAENEKLKDELALKKIALYDKIVIDHESENRKLRERIAKLRERHANIKITQCPHFARMKETCTCVYDEAHIAISHDDSLSDESRNMEKKG